MRGSMLGVLVMAVLLGACGQSTESESAAVTGTEVGGTGTATAAQETGAAAATAQNPCAAVSAEEVSSAVGLTVAAHEGDTENDCSYRTADDQVMLVVKIVDAAGFDAVAAMKGSESVSGLGDRATWSELSDSLLVVKGDRMLDVAYSESAEASPRASTEEKKTRAIALAEKLLPTIQG